MRIIALPLLLVLAGCPVEKVRKARTPDAAKPAPTAAELEAAVGKTPRRRPLHDQLIAALSGGEQEAALVKALRRALLLWPADADLHLKLSVALARTGKVAEARAAKKMQRALKGEDLSLDEPSPPDPESSAGAPTPAGEPALQPGNQRSLEAAQDLEGRDELDRAAAAYRELVRQAPGAGSAYIGLGRILSRQGAAGHAQGMFIKALILSPKHAGELVRSMGALGKSGEAEDALREVITQALKRREPDSVYLQRLGVQLRDTGKLELAEQVLRAAIKARPGDEVLEKDLATTLKLKEVVKE